MPPLLEVAAVSKSYGSLRALEAVSFAVDAGPAATLGPVTVKGLDWTDRDFIAKRATFAPNTKYSPGALDGMRGDLQSLDIFSSVKVDYKLFLNVLGAAIFAVLFGLTLRRGAAGHQHACEMHGGGHHEHGVSGAH